MLARCCVETFGLWKKKAHKRDSKEEQEADAAASAAAANVCWRAAASRHLASYM